METIRFARSLLLALALSPLQSKADSPAARLEPARLDGVALGAQAEVLYDCRFKYAQLPPSFIKLSILHLLDERGADPAGLPMETISLEASMGELSSSRLDPSLPFIFFINGFNNQGPLNGTWMEEVARTIARRNSNAGATRSWPGKANIIFLSWHISNLFAESLMATVPAYYKTMANYATIVDFVERALLKFVQFTELNRIGKQMLETEASEGPSYSKFKFYGHSLGAHIIAHAVSRLHLRKPHLVFAKIVGLDPANPCFGSVNNGISAQLLSNAVEQVAVLHSNTGIIGVTPNRATLDIMLNGGTFQPNCAWYDVKCHHMRATDIFAYLDDDCQMVAYACTNYQQFKLGACETCDQGSVIQANQQPNCVLVNLDYQHLDRESELVEVDAGANQPPGRGVRKLARERLDAEGGNRLRFGGERRQWASGNYSRSANGQAGFKYYFVNTNEKYRPNNGLSHCMQHYQLRLLILSDSGGEKCPLSSYYNDNIGAVSVQLLYESIADRFDLLQHYGAKLDFGRQESRRKELMPIIEDQLHTGLINFAGPPELFVGALLEGIDFKRWSSCLNKHSASSGVSFVLDLAFMSHTKQSVRQAYSSILCAKLNARVEKQEDPLVMNLCKLSDLVNVTDQVDKILSRVAFNHQYETWQISLLDTLFSLFTEWEPLRHYTPRSSSRSND